MIAMMLDDVSVGIEDHVKEDGEKFHVLVVMDARSGIHVKVVLSAETVRAIVGHLDGKPVIQLASKMPT